MRGLRKSSTVEPGGQAEQAADSAEPAESGDRYESGESGERAELGVQPSRGARTAEWFRALFRSAVTLVATLAVLAVLGGATDVVLHVTRHTSRSTTTYSSIDGVVVVLDGNVSLSVVGRTQGGQGAMLSAVGTSTPFDDPERTVEIIGGTLYLTERCPDSQCSAALTLTVDTDDSVSVAAGNADDIGQAVVEFNGIDGQASVTAAPASVVVMHTIVTGAVIGRLTCDTEVDCRDVAVPASG